MQTSGHYPKTDNNDYLIKLELETELKRCFGLRNQPTYSQL